MLRVTLTARNAPETPSEFDRVSIVFGDNPDRALPLMDAGKSAPRWNRHRAGSGRPRLHLSRWRKANPRPHGPVRLGQIHPSPRGQCPEPRRPGRGARLDGDHMTSVTKATPETPQAAPVAHRHGVSAIHIDLLPWRTVRKTSRPRPRTHRHPPEGRKARSIDGLRWW